MNRPGSSPRLPGLRPIGDSVGSIAARAATRRGFHEQRLLGDWPLIAGTDIAALCQPIRLRRQQPGSKQGVLELAVTAPGMALQLQYQELMLIERIRQYFGYSLVSRIKLRQKHPSGYK